MLKLNQLPLELICWISALIVLALSVSHKNHFSLCPLANLGIDICPGCGLGRSVSSLLHADISASFKYHWFGIPALAILLQRICILFKAFLTSPLINIKP